LSDDSKGVIRISIDTKAAIKIGQFSRGGYNRQGEEAMDHDFEAEEILKLFGIHIPETGENHFFFTPGNVTADFMVDRIQELWPDLKRRFDPHTIVINADNGPENSSSRTQFIKRIVEFAQNERIDVSLAYYPPYHSKYNPIERVFGVLENYWRSELFESVEKVVGLAKNMTWKGRKPVVKMIDRIYKTGIRLSKSAMNKYENLVDRLKGLEKWFVDIYCFSC
jgi:transposase